MPIDPKQRDKNSHNKLMHNAKEASDHPANYARSAKSSVGYLGRQVQSAARNTAMADSTGDAAYAGSKQEHLRNQALLGTVKRSTNRGESRRAVASLAETGAGDRGGMESARKQLERETERGKHKPSVAGYSDHNHTCPMK